MCLTKITTTHDQPSDLIVDGWKEFHHNASGLIFSQMGGVVKLDEWMQAHDAKPNPVVPGMIRAGDGKLYKAGFHAYAGQDSTYRRVYLRRITCEGNQDGRECVVAQEMYVPSDPNGWPPRPKNLMDRKRKS